MCIHFFVPSYIYIYVYIYKYIYTCIQGDQNVSEHHLMTTVQKTCKNILKRFNHLS
jgi:hypothetical protein